MAGKLVLSICILHLFWASRALCAPIFQDNFDSRHDFLAQGVSYTAWDGMEERHRAVQAASSLDHSGQLVLSSSGPIGPGYGVFLYETVEAFISNFVAVTKISDTATHPDQVIEGSHGGLLIRVRRESQTGQDQAWLALDYAPVDSLGNGIRQADSDEPELVCSNSQTWSLHPYLQIEKNGARVHCRTSQDGLEWHELPCSPIMREDFDGVALQVGLYVGSTTQGRGYLAFDSFSITHAEESNPHPLEAHHPNPAVGSSETTASVLSWEPGRTAVSHQVWLGTTPETMVLIADGLKHSWLPYEPGFEPGTTYYWRVDERTSSDTLITGPLWHFSMPVPEAHLPNPSHEQTNVIENNLTLSWHGGLGAIWHEVYFNRNRQAVASTAASARKGRFTNTTYQPGDLEDLTTYYWRVDEITLNGQIHPGPVWSFTTMASFPIVEPTLKAKWSFDEGGGTSVIDGSGFRHHGRLLGDPIYVDGIEGSALALDGIDDLALCAGDNLPTGQSEFTLSAWICPTVHSHTLMAWGQPQPGRANQFRLTGGDRCRHSFWGNTIEFVTGSLADEWHHLALVYNGSMRYAYVDGERILGTLLASAGGTPNVGRSEVTLGGSPWMNDYFEGKIDEVYIYEEGLNRPDIESLAAYPRLLATNPIPANGAVVESLDRLRWHSNAQVQGYDIYLGQDPQTVRQATPSGIKDCYLGRRSQKWIPIEITLGTEQIYYWRVDMVTDTTIAQGHLWSFQTAQTRFIDDFESYTDVSPDRIYQTWIDGQGFTQPFGVEGNGSGAVVGHNAAPYAETVTVYRGLQAMPIHFDNASDPHYSEVSRYFASSQDWHTGDFSSLCLYFLGPSGNEALSTDRLSVVVVDHQGRSAAAVYAGPISHLSDNTWHSWRVPVNTFETLNLGAVSELHIRIGGPDNADGGYGTLIIDDICLSSSP